MGRIAQKSVNTAGRKTIYDEPLDIRREQRFTESQYERLKVARNETGISMQEIVRRAVDEKLRQKSEEPKTRNIPLLGEIPGGALTEIKPAMPEQYVHPPFDDLPPDCYALEVRGDSMEDKYMKEHFGLSAPNGFYAFFAPGVMYPTMVAHVEVSNGQFEHTVTLKKVVEHGDKIELRPININHKPIIVPRNTVQIKGGFIRAWNPNEKAK